MNKLYFLGKPEDGFGWGVANTNLHRALAARCNVILDHSTRDTFDAPVFVPIANHALEPLRRIRKAPRVIGYCFTEWPLPDEAKRNARQYDVIFTGSNWNTGRLQAAGIKHAQTMIQGVDFDLFQPQPPSERKGFTVFSGGKYEFRKGQDIVIAAMKRFMGAHADVVLLAAWHNQWQQSVQSMTKSWLIDATKPFEGLPQDRLILLPPVPNARTPEIYRQAHIGVFPNRCEAGTNMVMCEFMASSRPVIASDYHGHRDVIGDGCYRLPNGSIDAAGWFNPPVSDVLAHLEHAYAHKEELPERGAQCRKLVERYTWADCAEKICNAAFRT